MTSTQPAKELFKIKLRSLWIEWVHWKKIGWRLLWRSMLMNYRIRTRRKNAALQKRH